MNADSFDIGGVRRVAVLGFGRSGRGAAKLASCKGFRVAVVDEGAGPELEKSAGACPFPGCEFVLGWKGGPLPAADLVVTSPGIPDGSPLLAAASSLGAPVISELEFGSLFSSAPIIAVTGTNGKTTTTELVTALISALGLRTVSAGNIGVPLSEISSSGEKYDFIVTEVSSFQLDRSYRFAPASAAVLNITSDHMNRYAGTDAYAESKFRIFRNIPSPERCLIRSDLAGYWNSFMGTPARPATFSGTDEAADYHSNRNLEIVRRSGGRDEILFCAADANLKGLHNVENILAAVALVLAAVPDADVAAMAAAALSFKAGEHRLEVIYCSGGITYINDSKATNPDSVVVALRTVGGRRNVCLVAGGLDKNMDFSPILSEKDKIKAIFLAGECKNKLASALGRDIVCNVFVKFEDAVLAACANAESGDVVLLSPGCASMDMFKDYKERGRKFIHIINQEVVRK